MFDLAYQITWGTWIVGSGCYNCKTVRTKETWIRVKIGNGLLLLPLLPLVLFFLLFFSS